ncbi:MAG: two-component sensor histidine kinase [Ahniella sp.]|nr:two-component sensor histidine kinase [Ahniella sp.]
MISGLSRFDMGDLARREHYFFSLYRVLGAAILVFVCFSSYARQVIVIDSPRLMSGVAIGYLIAAAVIFSLGQIEIRRLQWASRIGLGLDILTACLAIQFTQGMDSGIASLLVMNIACGGVLFPLSQSLTFAAAASSAGFLLYSWDLQRTGGLPERSIGEVGLFVLIYFAVTGLAQLLQSEVAQRQKVVERQESDIAGLSQLNDLIIRRMRTGVLVLLGERIVRFNEAAWMLLGSPPQSASMALPDRSAELIARFRHWRVTGENDEQAVSVADGTPEVVPRFVTVPQAGEPLTIVFLEDTSMVSRQAEELTLSSLGRLSASIAHEIRNPLGAISHASQLLAESEQLSESDQHLLGIVRKHCLRMNAIIENILQLSRRKRARPESVSLPVWVTEFAQEFRAVQPLGEDTLLIEVADNLPNIIFDPDQLQQVVWNLTKNAMRYGRKPGAAAQVRICARRLDTSGPVVLEVCDAGPGIDPRLATQIFDPFFSTGEQSTGLGLYIASQICAANQASIDQVSAPEGGACFRIGFQSGQITVH